MEFFNKIPVMEANSLRELKKGIDLGFRNFSRAYGDAIEGFFDPLLYFLIWLEKLLVTTPWPIVIGILGLLAWVGSRNIKLVIGTILCFVPSYFHICMEKNCLPLRLTDSGYIRIIISILPDHKPPFRHSLLPITNTSVGVANRNLRRSSFKKKLASSKKQQSDKRLPEFSWSAFDNHRSIVFQQLHPIPGALRFSPSIRDLAGDRFL